MVVFETENSPPIFRIGQTFGVLCKSSFGRRGFCVYLDVALRTFVFRLFRCGCPERFVPRCCRVFSLSLFKSYSEHFFFRRFFDRTEGGGNICCAFSFLMDERCYLLSGSGKPLQGKGTNLSIRCLLLRLFCYCLFVSRCFPSQR